MPRRPRFWVHGGVYHVTVRGNDRQTIFHDDTDCQQYLLGLHQCRQELPYRTLAFVLMPNHVHLLLEASAQAPVSDVMHRISTTYTRYVNNRYDRVGQLYQGRFYSNFVDRQAYLLEVTRYIHLNPVRAHLVQRPDDYLWSSFRIYAGIQRDPLNLVECEQVLALFGATLPERLDRYRRFVEGLAAAEQDAWVRKLQHNRLIPPRRWKVPGTS